MDPAPQSCSDQLPASLSFLLQVLLSTRGCLGDGCSLGPLSPTNWACQGSLRGSQGLRRLETPRNSFGRTQLTGTAHRLVPCSQPQISLRTDPAASPSGAEMCQLFLRPSSPHRAGPRDLILAFPSKGWSWVCILSVLTEV